MGWVKKKKKKSLFFLRFAFQAEVRLTSRSPLLRPGELEIPQSGCFWQLHRGHAQVCSWLVEQPPAPGNGPFAGTRALEAARGLTLFLLSRKIIINPIPPYFHGVLALHDEAGRGPRRLEQWLERGAGPAPGFHCRCAKCCVSFIWHI